MKKVQKREKMQALEKLNVRIWEGDGKAGGVEDDKRDGGW